MEHIFLKENKMDKNKTIICSEQEEEQYSDEELFLFVRYHIISKSQIIDEYKRFLKTHKRLV